MLTEMMVKYIHDILYFMLIKLVRVLKIYMWN